MVGFIGEIRLFAGNFPPAGWAFCDGAPQAISENDALFVVLGTTYGGDGEETFNLPDLQGRVPVHQGTGPGGITYQMGETGGVEQVTLSTSQIPNHTHPMIASSDPASRKGAKDSVLGRAAADAYASEYTPDSLSPNMVTPQGGSQPHENMQPYIGINYIISLFGLFPHT